MDEYKRFARLYDLLVGPFLKPIHKTMLSALSAAGSHTIVDLCCGTGQLAGMIADTGKKVVGVDLSSAMLRVGRKKHPSVTFLDGDAASLIFEDGEFDAATISFGLHEKPEPMAQAILAEARRVVDPDGIILVADYRVPQHAKPKWMAVSIALIEQMAGADHFDRFTAYMHAGGTELFLKRGGLVAVPVGTYLHGWAGVYVGR